jgi:hypothetical protein
MLNITVTGLTSTNRKVKQDINKLVDAISNDVLVFARANTPIRLGTARAGWKKQRQTNGFSIKNKVPYIDKLNQGSSKQSPEGILKPTLQQIRSKY